MRLALWLTALAVLVLVTWMIWGGGMEQQFTLQGSIAWLESSGPWAWAAGIGLLASDLLLPVPGTLVMSALGYLYGPWLGGLCAAIGSISSGLLGYGIGRLMGEKTARKLLGEKDFARGHALFTRGGGWIIALSRPLPILPEALTCTAGLVRMPFGRFFLSLCCGSVPIGLIFAWIGAAGREAPAWALAASIAIPAALWFLARRWK